MSDIEELEGLFAAKMPIVAIESFEEAKVLQMAERVAGAWQLPLFRMDFGALYQKYHGETEKNVRDALAMANAMQPCVLWMDEIEKELGRTRPLSVVMAEKVAGLRAWARERAVSVD